jgi:hypothetical protein
MSRMGISARQSDPCSELNPRKTLSRPPTLVSTITHSSSGKHSAYVILQRFNVVSSFCVLQQDERKESVRARMADGMEEIRLRSMQQLAEVIMNCFRVCCLLMIYRLLMWKMIGLVWQILWLGERDKTVSIKELIVSTLHTHLYTDIMFVIIFSRKDAWIFTEFEAL